MLNYDVKNFKYGMIDNLEKQSIPSGSSSDSLNWLTLGDRIELSRGYKLIGSDAGVGRVTGLHVAKKTDGEELLYVTHGRKLKFYDTTTSDWNEVGTDTLPVAADGEDVSFADFFSLAGQQLWISSPNSSLYKIMMANPDDIVDQYDSAKNFKGLIRIAFSRMDLWACSNDKTGIYGSYVDKATYTTVTAEVLGAGNSVLVTFSGTLAFKAAGAKRTCFAISVTDGVETFSDDYNGNLTGSLGGTGTINYATGAISVTFHTAPGAVNITATYQWEDSTNNGIADFTKSSPRQAAQGFIFRQDDGGGNMQAMLSYNDIDFCLHENKTWKLVLADDDASATNKIWRERAGIPYWRAAVSTGDGIFYMDDSDKAEPKFRLLTFGEYSAEVEPITVTNNLDLKKYDFSQSVGIEYGNYIIFACKTANSSVNNRILMYHKIWKCLDVRDYYVSCFAIWGGTLIAGDSVTNNVYELFSGFDDDDSVIDNHWDSNLSRLDVDELKKCKRLIIEGEISKEQSIEVYLDLDRGGFVKVGQIDGTGSYVDKTPTNKIGVKMLGTAIIGGDSEVIDTYHYKGQIKLHLDKFSESMIRFKAIGIGYASVSMYDYFDLRPKGQKLPKKYRT